MNHSITWIQNQQRDANLDFSFHIYNKRQDLANRGFNLDTSLFSRTKEELMGYLLCHAQLQSIKGAVTMCV